MAVKCLFIDPPPPVPRPITWGGRAVEYILAVGWDHVAAGLCTSTKCVQAKTFIDKGYVVLHPKYKTHRPCINYVADYYLKTHKPKTTKID